MKTFFNVLHVVFAISSVALLVYLLGFKPNSMIP